MSFGMVPWTRFCPSRAWQRVLNDDLYILKLMVAVGPIKLQHINVAELLIYAFITRNLDTGDEIASFTLKLKVIEDLIKLGE